VAPLTPPYEQWFKNGDTKFKVDYFVGDSFWDEELNAYTSQGFARKDNPDGTVSLTRHYDEERAGEKFETDVELVMHNGPQGMFDHMNDPSVKAVVYSGHADYGREVPSHLANSPDMKGDKAFFALQCGGKGIHDALLEHFPDLQVVASKNSSYGYQDRATFLNSLEGISKRLPWSQISTQNASRNSENYYFPSDTLISRRAQDRDHDGNADAWDRVMNVNPFHPEAEIAAQLTPKSPGRRADEIDGRAVTGAMLRYWRMAGYNEWAKDQENQGVVSKGFYEGKKTDPLFRTTEVNGPDGKKVLQLQVNSQYAHASEEVLGAAMHYELGRMAAKKSGLSDGDAKAAGLLMAAKALDIDTAYDDEDAWHVLLKYAELPQTIPYGLAMSANHGSEEFPAGSAATLAVFKESLKAEGITL
jgi:hypothetical protein